jgi:hypothetical protein
MRSFLGVGANFGGEHSDAKIITLTVGEDNEAYCLAITVTKGEPIGVLSMWFAAEQAELVLNTSLPYRIMLEYNALLLTNRSTDILP